MKRNLVGESHIHIEESTHASILYVLVVSYGICSRMRKKIKKKCLVLVYNNGLPGWFQPWFVVSIYIVRLFSISSNKALAF